MSNENDKKILELKLQILKKKEQLESIKKFTPVTNCSIELDSQRYNINTLPQEQLIQLLVKVNMYQMSASDLELEYDYTISGYTPIDWITDLSARLDILSKKDEERKLKALEDKLDKLLSSDKKTELELSEIENMLK